MSFAVTWARRHRTIVLLNYDELNAVLAAAPQARRNRPLASARRRLERARERRRKAVARARR